MATCLQVPMVVPSTLGSSSSSSCLFDMNPPKIGWRNVVSKRRLNYRCSSSKIPLPPIDLNDPFIQRFAAYVQANPEPSPNSQYPPFLDFLQNPPKSSSPSPSSGGGGGRRDSHVAQARAPQRQRQRSANKRYGYGIHRTNIPPPDLASIFLDERIVFLGMPLVDEVSELIMTQFLFLQWVDDTAPIYLYINCTGTTRDDNQIVAHPGNGIAVYDIMTSADNPVETVCIGACSGSAALLLAAGTFGRRAMLPHCTISLKVPPVLGTGLLPAGRVSSKAIEAQIWKDKLLKLFAYHTGNRFDEIAEKLMHTWHFDAKDALEFGVIDRIIWREKMGNLQDDLGLTPEQWDKVSRGKPIYEP